MARPKSDKSQRETIVNATLNCFHQFGYEGTTVARICKATGLSAGNIHYHFGGKKNLLEEAMRVLLRDVRARMVDSLRKADSPADRITAIVESNLHPDLFNQPICTTWLHFWAQAPHAEELSRLERVNRARFRQNLRHEFGQLYPRERTELLITQLVAMVDGFWIEKAQPGATIDSQQAIYAVKAFLQGQR
ncbi:transcriptional regulator BetI [Pseudohalocynthiibacter aestuariivivens]|nr:transcriptional regulator BetI [Pseudohalocynthiibacter aestuariivivens]QIE45524.1 transcriptional regulator BetI [Pseudohalocynthiibacter aestuariivivens]